MPVHHPTPSVSVRMRQGFRTEDASPDPARLERGIPPLPQTAAQREVEERILTAAGWLAPRLGLSPATSCGRVAEWRRRSSP